LARHLGKDQTFYGLQALGLKEEHIKERRIEDMATYYIQEIRTVQPHGPYFLGGYCLGGCLAFEMAQQLKMQNEEVTLLVMIQSRHRNYRKYLPNTTILQRLIYCIEERIDYEMSNLSKLGLKAKFSYTSQRLQRAISLIQIKIMEIIELSLSQLHLSIPSSWSYAYKNVAKMHREAFWSYEPRPYHGRVVIFRANKQPPGVIPDPTLGWGALIGGELETYEIPAYHQTILWEPQVQVMANLMRSCLDKVQGVSD
jgi:thioesterase domain-containing protein